ncbi:hypothetical protein SAMN04488515_2388 [Cognatiyoonia koreensis]|uniref:Uncharacterized protein n=1 Tax=Cognatiyoonia koreensis TaxID=364200 RepID=A0A1I0RBV5_9RHOB|nr:hypothetical protein [Cognatiyoonia koreensis]SEW37727.1 hypothetical protein SAMN04488515_2388 [Cognatiyoonia koreensis]
MRTLFIWLLCHLVVVAASPVVWTGVADGYVGDSFWTLSDVGQIGVIAICLSGLLTVATVNAWKTLAILRMSHHRWRISVWLLDVVLGLGVFAIAYVLSPQVFYSFYQQLFPSLPDQWVIDSAANWTKLLKVTSPRHGASLSDHIAGIAMGGIVLFTAYLHRR